MHGLPEGATPAASGATPGETGLLSASLRLEGPQPRPGYHHHQAPLPSSAAESEAAAALRPVPEFAPTPK